MSLRAALSGALVALLLAAAPASAQEPEPVVGAGSFTTAPILEPGSYRDTVLPEEYLYYGVRVAAGQRLHVKLEVGLTAAEFTNLGIAFVQVNLHGPDRAQLFDATGPDSTSGSDSAPADTISPEARSLEQARTSVSSGWQGPGVYFIAVYAPFVGSGELTKAEVPITFSVALEGQAQSEPSPTATPTASPTPEASAAPPEAAQEATTTTRGGGGGRRRRRAARGRHRRDRAAPTPSLSSAAPLRGRDPLADVGPDRGGAGHGDEHEPRHRGVARGGREREQQRDRRGPGDRGGVADGRGRVARARRSPRNPATRPASAHSTNQALSACPTLSVADSVTAAATKASTKNAPAAAISPSRNGRVIRPGRSRRRSRAWPPRSRRRASARRSPVAGRPWSGRAG